MNENLEDDMEQVPDTFPALFNGYAAIWAFLLVYVGYLGFRVRRLERLGPGLSQKGPAPLQQAHTPSSQLLR